MKRLMFFCFTFFILPTIVGSQETWENPSLKLNLPLFDLPYQIDLARIYDNFFESYTHPGMDFTLNINNMALSSLHFGMEKLKDVMGLDLPWKKLVYYGGISLVDFLLYFLPIPTGFTWMHESFHVAGFTYAGHRSHLNYDFPNGAYAVADSGESVNWPAEIRTTAAGIESEYLQVEKMQRNNFFYNQNLYNEGFYWLANSQVWVYAYMPFISGGIKQMIIDDKKKETYPDSLQWAYFLFHHEGALDEVAMSLPNFSDDEKSFLKTRVLLSLINFASPMMFTIRSIPLGAETGWYGNFAFRHLYTSFGTDLVFNAYLKKAPFNMAFAYHSYMNYENYFPAIEAELIDFPLSQILPASFFEKVYASPRVLIGMQPEDQIFKTAEPEFMGLFGLRLDFAVTKNIFPFIDFTAKTDGWVVGNEYLKGGVSLKLGVSARF